MRIIGADVLKKAIHSGYSDDLKIIEKIDEQPTVPSFGKWHEIKKDGLPKESGYYLVAIERQKWNTKEKDYKTSLIFFRGKTTWATCNGSIKAWMDLPDDFKRTDLKRVVYWL